MEQTERQSSSGESRRPMPEVRAPRFDFGAVPRFWFNGNPVATQMSNGVNLLFPSGERFFIRSVKHFAERIDDPRLKEEVLRFYGQEGQHGAAHQRHFQSLRDQGYDIDGFLRIYEKICWGFLEPRMTPELRLAITAALEHYTAIMAEGALGHGVLDLAHPTMQALLKWHAAEEIEHKAVAFDVLRTLAPGHANRVAGMAVATVGLIAFWVAATAWLLSQDVRRGDTPTLENVRMAANRERSLVRDVFLAGIRDYVRKDFHPLQRENTDLATQYLATAGVS